jgi:hypothetical protein
MNYIMFHLLHEFFEIWPFFWIESIYHVQLKNNPIGVKFQGALDVVDYYFTTTFSDNFELVQREMCYKCIT